MGRNPLRFEDAGRTKPKTVAIMATSSTQQLFKDLRKSASEVLPPYLVRQRWFGGKARRIGGVQVVDLVSILGDRAFVVLAEVRYEDGPKETYVLPLWKVDPTAVGGHAGSGEALRLPGAGAPDTVLQDALQNAECLHGLLDVLAAQRRMPGLRGEIRAVRSSAFEALHGATEGDLTTTPLRAEQSNTSIRYGSRLILKFFRRLQEGINPDLEIGRFLTDKAHFPHVPAVAGSLEYVTRTGKTMTMGILQAFVTNQGSAWDEALQYTADFFRRIEEGVTLLPPNLPQPGELRLLDLAQQKLSPEIAELAGTFLNTARLLGERTAQFHTALASEASDPAFAPESFTPAFRSKLGTSMHSLTARVLGLLRQKQEEVPERWRDAAARVVGSEPVLTDLTDEALRHTSSAMRTRIHGDYHLGQVLRTGTGMVIIDFEGEPARTIKERRIKRSPLQDVAGMVRSFHYAAYVPLLGPAASETAVRKVDAFETWAARWYEWMAGHFLRAYLETSGSSRHLPSNPTELAGLLDFHLLEKAVYELGYELDNRPAWVGIPLAGICRILGVEK
jgi:trehalose synthase-fused probable maltokinase